MLSDTLFPFFDVGKTLAEMDRMFGAVGRPLGLRSVPRGTFPAVNVYLQDDVIVLLAEIPGVAAEALDVTVLGDTVTLKGKRDAGSLSNGDRYYRRERMSGDFERTITLPELIDPDSVRAEYKNGVLKVRMAKAEKAKVKKIEINS